MTAARTGIPAAVKTLLAHGADVNAKESWRGQTALMWAAAEGHADDDSAAPRGRRAGQRAIQRRMDGAAVCGARRKDSGGQDAARRRSERRRYAARAAGPRARRGCGRCGAAGAGQRPPSKGSSALVLAVGSGAFRAGCGAARCGRRSECGRAGMDGAPSPHLDSQARHRQQRSCALRLGQHGQPDARQKAEGARRGCERASDAAARTSASPRSTSSARRRSSWRRAAATPS